MAPLVLPRSLHLVAEILPGCVARFWCRSPRTPHLLGEHCRQPVQFFHLHRETDTVGITTFADEGMKLPVVMKIIENISHHFCLDAAERDLTPIMTVASEIRDCYHMMPPLKLVPPFMNRDAKGKYSHLPMACRWLLGPPTLQAESTSTKILSSISRIAGSGVAPGFLVLILDITTQETGSTPGRGANSRRAGHRPEALTS